MTSLMPTLVTGEVVPGSVVQPQFGFPFNQSMPARVQRSYVTNIPHGPPIKEEPVKSVPIAPRPTGDERGNAQMMKILQNVLQKQGGGQASSAPIAKALPGDRSWRG